MLVSIYQGPHAPRTESAPPDGRYLELVKEFPLRLIADEPSYRRAIEVLDRLFEIGERRTQAETDYFRVLALIAWQYEES